MGRPIGPRTGQPPLVQIMLAGESLAHSLLRRGRARLGANPWWVDTLLAAALLAGSLPPLLGWGAGNCGCPARPAWAYLLVAGQILPLTARRSRPFAVALLIAPFAVLYGASELPDAVVPFGPLVAVYSAAAYATRRQF